MAFIMSITVHNDNDPSCRTFTMTQEFNSVDEPSPEIIKFSIKECHRQYREAHPYNHALPTFLPTEVEIVPAQNRIL